MAEIQYTRIVKTYFSTDIEEDALAALLDEHMIGDTGESLSDRLWAASAYSTDGFWVALADLGGTQTVDTETDWDLDEEDTDESDGEDDDEDDEDREEFDVDEFDADTTLDLSALVA